MPSNSYAPDMTALFFCIVLQQDLLWTWKNLTEKLDCDKI